MRSCGRNWTDSHDRRHGHVGAGKARPSVGPRMPVRQTIHDRPPPMCPATLAQARENGHTGCRTGKRTGRLWRTLAMRGSARWTRTFRSSWRKSGRKPVITGDKLNRARGMVGTGLTVREIATRLKVGKTALYEALKGAISGSDCCSVESLSCLSAGLITGGVANAGALD